MIGKNKLGQIVIEDYGLKRVLPMGTSLNDAKKIFAKEVAKKQRQAYAKEVKAHCAILYVRHNKSFSKYTG